ncbi:hypothetical protein HY491_03765 [Candidatus Woesearchaeota archaeon]|nr:hypothetical protein [Candidatus Woesearchaeota archaeon]
MGLQEKKRELHAIGQRKQELWQQLQQDKEQRNAIVEAVKALREKRDALTKEVALIKQEQKRLQAAIAAKGAELQAARDGKKQMMEKLGMKEPPESIRRKMKAIEQKIETQVISFEKEKQMMDALKRLKKQCTEAEQLGSASAAVAQRAAELRELQAKEREVWRDVQQRAAASHQHHREMLARRKELDALREKQGQDFAAYDSLKKQKREAVLEVQGQAQALALQKEGQARARAAAEEARKREAEAQLQAKEKVLEEKIRKKKKITTEDLLVFQGK